MKEAYRRRYGHYPEKVPGDPLYGTRANRRYLKERGIHFAGKPLGRPRKATEENQEELKRLKAQRCEEYLQRIPIEGKFVQGKDGYRLNYIRAKLPATSGAWINGIFLVMNLLVLLRAFFALCCQGGVQGNRMTFRAWAGTCGYKGREGLATESLRIHDVRNSTARERTLLIATARKACSTTFPSWSMDATRRNACTN
jgi:hypothetical protein